jgi:REP element-mobilizing transposase RayT
MDAKRCTENRDRKRTGPRSAGKTRALRTTQGAFAFKGRRGGARKGAGRKPKGARAGIPHRSRPAHAASEPVQATTRLRAGLPSLRHARELAVVRHAIDAASARQEFRVIHHSIQSNHLHLIVEAHDREALSTGMRALLVRIARALNRLWERAGAIFADRFHERALRTPSEVRNSLVYVLQNARKHGIAANGPDAYSSGPWFDGWREVPGLGDALARQRERIETRLAEVWYVLAGGRRVGRASAPGLKAMEPTTWLLRIGWKRKGLIDPEERPRSVSESPGRPCADVLGLQLA